MGRWAKIGVTLLAVAALTVVGFNAIGVASRAGDVSGPCDEAEHANDPRCTGAPAVRDELEPGEDVSGRCDEAEHANDPRCTGAPREDNSGPGSIDDDEDRSGPGSIDDDRDDDRDEDHRGPSENSGPGSRDDDRDDDSGSGSDDD